MILSRNEKVTPITLVTTEKWVTVSEIAKDATTTITKTKYIEHGIQIQPALIDGYRRLIKVLNNYKTEYSTYARRPERDLKCSNKRNPQKHRNKKFCRKSEIQWSKADNSTYPNDQKIGSQDHTYGLWPMVYGNGSHCSAISKSATLLLYSTLKLQLNYCNKKLKSGGVSAVRDVKGNV